MCSMNILFITATRIGDAVLSTGILEHMYRTYPQGKVTVACGHLAHSLFTGFPNVVQVIPLKKRAYAGHWVDLWRLIAGQKWDIVIDLRNSAVSRLIWANKRYIFGKHINRTQHKVIQAGEVLGLSEPPAPRLYFTADQEKFASDFIPPSKKILAVGPAANWIGKTWPADRFIEVIKWMIAPGGVMAGASVAVFAAPGEEAQARPVLESVPTASRIDGIAKGSPGAVACALSKCHFYLGNDSGLMHCAAAAGVPTLGLYGPSWPHIYRPWGKHTAYVATPENFDELIDFPDYDPKTLNHTLMTSLTVETVKQAVQSLTDYIGGNVVPAVDRRERS